jgi:D-sedoheptulose 7-phosphate isomerase
MNNYPESAITKAFEDHESLLDFTKEKCTADILKLSELIIDALSNGHKVLWAGNGGSAADCQHLAAELVGRFVRERKGLSSIALTTDSSILTAIGNDYGYESVFSRQVEAIANSGDVVIGITTSGNSHNILNAMQVAQKKGCITVGMTGKTGGKMAEMGLNVCIKVPSKITARIQEMHILIGHIVCDIVEEYFFKMEID